MIWKMIAVTSLVAVLSTEHAGESARSGQFPVVDAHAHIGGSFKWTTIIEAKDKNGVSRQIVMASAYPGLVRTESVMRATAFLDLSNSDSLQFIGRAVAALASDPDVLKRAGTVCVAAALGREYGFYDIDGKQPVPLSLEDV
jgi:hypothetical protein